MHSRIFQISTKPIEEDDLLTSWKLEQEDYNFCDYIGDEDDEDARLEDIEYLQLCLKDIFDAEDDHLVVKKGISLFINEWDKYMHNLVFELGEKPDMHSLNMYRIKRAAEGTHLMCCYRFFIREWNGWPGPLTDLVEFVHHSLKPGDKLYIGSVIDYHF